MSDNYSYNYKNSISKIYANKNTSWKIAVVILSIAAIALLIGNLAVNNYESTYSWWSILFSIILVIIISIIIGIRFILSPGKNSIKDIMR